MRDTLAFIMLVLVLYLIEHPEAGGRWFGAFIRAMGFG